MEFKRCAHAHFLTAQVWAPLSIQTTATAGSYPMDEAKYAGLIVELPIIVLKHIK